jgi:hypothetical protein
VCLGCDGSDLSAGGVFELVNLSIEAFYECVSCFRGYAELRLKYIKEEPVPEVCVKCLPDLA